MMNTPITDEMAAKRAAILNFWYKLNEFYRQNSNKPMSIAFNGYCFSWAERLRLPNEAMNSIINYWATTLATEPPNQFVSRKAKEFELAPLDESLEYYKD